MTYDITRSLGSFNVLDLDWGSTRLWSRQNWLLCLPQFLLTSPFKCAASVSSLSFYHTQFVIVLSNSTLHIPNTGSRICRRKWFNNQSITWSWNTWRSGIIQTCTTCMGSLTTIFFQKVKELMQNFIWLCLRDFYKPNCKQSPYSFKYT